MKTLYFFISILSLQLFQAKEIAAQDAQVKWGKIEQDVAEGFITETIGWDSSGFYVISKKPYGTDHVFLEKYSNDCNRVFIKELTLPIQNNKKVDFQNLFVVDGQLMMLTSFYNRKEGKNYAFASKVSNKGEVDGNLKIIDEITIGKKLFNPRKFKFTLSQDSSRVLIYHENIVAENENCSFSLKVIDKNINILWEKETSVPFGSFYFSVKKLLLSNDGNVYMLAGINEDGIRKKDGKPTYKFIILSYSAKQNDPKEHTISIDDRFISGITITLDKHNNLNCAGFYSLKGPTYFYYGTTSAYTVKDLNNVSGAFFIQINTSSNKIISQKTKDFDTEVISGVVNNENAKREISELIDYELRQLVIKEDGSAVLIAEQCYINLGDNNGRANSYHYNDILVVGITNNGEINWTKRIPKRQFYSHYDASYSSFATSVYKDKINLVYNEIKENINVNVSLYGLLNATTVLITIDSEGNFTKKSLFDNRKEAVITRPQIFLQCKENELIIRAEKKEYYEYKNNYKFGTIKLD